ncbi:MAG: hypothetical protein CMH57_02865 [Myxococcales bacterium]|nr:hypothetical protein [Myxococcales bacterium]
MSDDHNTRPACGDRTLPASLGALMCVAAMTVGCAQANASTFFSAGSGDWAEPATWSLRGGDPDADGVPDETDLIVIQEGHAITIATADAAATELRIQGSLLIPPGDPRTLTLDRLRAYPGGRFEATGAHQIILRGALADNRILIDDDASLSLEGELSTAQGVIEEIVEENTERLILRVSGLTAASGGLTGHRLKLLTGNGRLWIFDVTSHDGDLITLDPATTGLPTPKAPFEALEIDPTATVLTVPEAFVQIADGDPRDRLLSGQWVRRALSDGGWSHHLLVSAADNGPGTPDTLRIWPPLPVGTEGPFEVTWRLAPGDTFITTNPLRLDVPPEYRPPNRQEGRHFRLVTSSGTDLVRLRYVHLGQATLRIEPERHNPPEQTVELSHVTVTHSNSSCVLLTQTSNLTLDGVVIQEIHPQNDTEAFGGNWQGSDQRGHGVCMNGDDLAFLNGRLSNLNDDMLYVAAASNVTVEDSIMRTTGVYHGNSHENITLYNVSGDIRITGNLASNTGVSVNLDNLNAPGSLLLSSNVIISQRGATVLTIDGSITPARAHDNIILGGDRQTSLRDPDHLLTLEHNAMRRAQIVGAPRLAFTLIHNDAPSGSTVIDVPDLESNVIYANNPDALGVITLTEPTTHLTLTRNSIASGAGHSVDLSNAATATLLGNLFVGTPIQLAPPTDAPSLDAEHNWTTSDTWVTPSSTTNPITSDTNRSGPITPLHPTRLLITDPDHPARTAGPDGEPVGFEQAGVFDKERLPIPVLCEDVYQNNALDLPDTGGDTGPDTGDVGSDVADTSPDPDANPDTSLDTNQDTASDTATDAEADTLDPADTPPEDTTPEDTAVEPDTPDDTTQPDTTHEDTSPQDTSPQDTASADTTPEDTAVEPDTPDAQANDTGSTQADTPSEDTLCHVAQDTATTAEDTPTDRGEASAPIARGGARCSTQPGAGGSPTGIWLVLLWIAIGVGQATRRRGVVLTPYIGTRS